MTSTNYTEYPIGLPWYKMLLSYPGGGCDHFYTSDVDEANNAKANDGYHFELRGPGQWGAAGWLLPIGSGQTPLYRARAQWIYGGVNRQDHFYTIDQSEIQAPYVIENGGAPIGEVYVGTAASVPKHAFPMYRGVKSFPNTGGSEDHNYSVQPSDLAANGYTLFNNGDPYFWVFPARSSFILSDNGQAVIGGPRFTSGDGITYQDGDIEMNNDQTAAWVRPRGISTWTFNRLQWEDSNGTVVATPPTMEVQTTSGMIRLEDKDVDNTTTQQYRFSVWTNLPGGPFKIDPKVVNRPTTGDIIN